MIVEAALAELPPLEDEQARPLGEPASPVAQGAPADPAPLVAVPEPDVPATPPAPEAQVDDDLLSFDELLRKMDEIIQRIRDSESK
jgi:hypothetical protein